MRYFKNKIKLFLINYSNRSNKVRVYSSAVDLETILGYRCVIAKDVIIRKDVSIGRYTYFNGGKTGSFIDSKVSIGNFCSIAPGVSIGIQNHPTNILTTHPIAYDMYYNTLFNLKDKQIMDGTYDKNKETIIGNDVWIGENAWIKRGVRIGDGVIIGAGAVVTKDVPDYFIYGGVPAAKIGQRFPNETILELKGISNPWWNWNEERIVECFDIIYDVRKYIIDHK